MRAKRTYAKWRGEQRKQRCAWREVMVTMRDFMSRQLEAVLTANVTYRVAITGGKLVIA